MLSFPTNLANELRDKHASSYWYIKLYYGDETNFTGLSDTDRTFDSVKYRGLVIDWGSLIHSINLNQFSSSVAAMNGLRISNIDDTISGGRFSDLFSSQNYVNRKFTLHMGAVGVAFADHIQLAEGLITDQIDQDIDTLTLSLLEDTASVNVEVPTTRVNATDHANAPPNNFGKPIPMSFGDFGLETDIGTVPPSGANFDRHFVKSHFPAIITDRWNATDANVIALPDQPGSVLNDLVTERVYYYGDDKFAACGSSNVTVDASVPEITFNGEIWRTYFQLGDATALDQDNDFLTKVTYTVDGTFTIDAGFKIPKIPKLGELTSISVIIDFGTFAGTAPIVDAGFPFYLLVDGGSPQQIVWDSGDKTIDISSNYTTAQQDAWDFEDTFKLFMDDTGAGGSAGDQSFEVNEIGLEIQYTPSQTFVKEYTTYSRTRTRRDGSTSVDRLSGRTFEVATPEVSEYIYCAGKGREYGEWVDADSRNNGYNAGALIENPVYQIENLLRSEFGTITTGTTTSTSAGNLVDSGATFTTAMVGQQVTNTTDGTVTYIDGFNSSTSLSVNTDIFASSEGYKIAGLTSSEIDYATFDAAGNTSDGNIGSVFDTAVSNIEFAFSQYKFQNGWALCQELASSCGCFLFLSGSGKVKIVTRKRNDGYGSGGDKTIKYDEIKNIKPGITGIDDARNRISVNYDYNYSNDTFKDVTAATNDTTSQGSGATGINTIQELIIDNRFTLDSATAIGYSTALKNWLAYRKETLSFEVITPKHNDIEIGDTIDFSGWPSTFKLYGNEITSADVFMITKIQKFTSGCSIDCQEVTA